MARFAATLRRFGIIVIASAVVSIGSLTFLLGNSSALSGSDFHAGHIIDDTIFTNSSAMSVGQIQNFLNSKVSCDTNGNLSKSYYYNSSSGRVNNSADTWVTTSRAVYGQRYDAWNGTTKAAAPYVCLPQYVENPSNQQNNLQNPGASISGGQSAAQIIWNAAQAYQINPQVLIATLQKEQGLVTDDWPWTNEYQIAMGYACPDSAPCDSQYYGFANQVTNAARQFRRYLNNPTNYNYVVGNNYILWSPGSGCGGSTVNIQNEATAALYDYTPYQPNAAALANVSDSSTGGTGDGCSSYGNRNFWWYFNTWFGTSLAPSYSWQILNTTYSTGSNTLALGQPVTVTVYAENTGTAMWYNGGANPVRLGLWQSNSSPLYTAGWFAPNRAATMDQSQVPPGGTATFTFPVNTNSLGTFIPKFNIVVENSQWLPWPGFSPTINVVNGYSWSVQNVIYSSGGGIIEPGSTQHITVKALNTGLVTWSQTSGPPVRLGEWGSSGPSPVNYNWISPTRAATMDEATVAPGQVGTFEFDVRVPGTGNYYDRLNLVAEGMTWFNDAGLTLYLRGGVDSWQPLWSAYSLGGNANIPRGTSFYVTVKAKNTGELTWTNGNTAGLPPIRLATVNPLDRTSILYDSSWISTARPTALIESSVPPGQQGTFVFKVNIPSNAPLGPRNEYFSLVAEGEQWFNNPNFSIYINVTP